jgi:hypothetical protein
MTTIGLLIMIASIGTVTLLFSWCVWKVLSAPEKEVHGIDLHTPDMDVEE